MEPTVVSESPVPENLTGRITDVQINGLRRVEEAALMAAVGMRAGELLAAWKIRRDLIAVYETGFVEDVRVDVSPVPDADPNAEYPPVVVTFEINENLIKPWKIHNMLGPKDQLAGSHPISLLVLPT